jgi:aspartokinase
MLSKMFGPKVHYLGDEETVSLDEFRTDKFVEAAAGVDAFMTYVDLRAEGKPQLTAFVTAFGRTFCGKPEALVKAAEAFETTSQYTAAYSDARQRIDAAKRLEAKRLADSLAAIEAPRSDGISDEAAAEQARYQREYNRTERERIAAHHEQIAAAVNNDNGFYFS